MDNFNSDLFFEHFEFFVNKMLDQHLFDDEEPIAIRLGMPPIKRDGKMLYIDIEVREDLDETE